MVAVDTYLVPTSLMGNKNTRNERRIWIMGTEALQSQKRAKLLASAISTQWVCVEIWGFRVNVKGECVRWTMCECSMLSFPRMQYQNFKLQLKKHDIVVCYSVEEYTNYLQRMCTHRSENICNKERKQNSFSVFPSLK